MNDREEIEHLKRQLRELSGELHLIRREQIRFIREVKEAIAYIWEAVKPLLGHPTPGNAVAVMITEKPIHHPRKETPS